MGLEEFNSDEFEPEIPEFHPPSVESNMRAFNRVLPKSLQNLIGRAALAARWGNHYGAERIRQQAGYGGISGKEFDQDAGTT